MYTGNCSGRLNPTAATASRKQSPGSPGASTTRGNSPLPPWTSIDKSLCSGLVGIPVEGPARWQSTITSGTSADPACETPSCIRARPGPEVAVIARTPVRAAPIAMFTADSSSSAWTARPPNRGIWRSIDSRISEAGVIGYPVKEPPPRPPRRQRPRTGSVGDALLGGMVESASERLRVGLAHLGGKPSQPETHAGERLRIGHGEDPAEQGKGEAVLVEVAAEVPDRNPGERCLEDHDRFGQDALRDGAGRRVEDHDAVGRHSRSEAGDRLFVERDQQVHDVAETAPIGEGAAEQRGGVPALDARGDAARRVEVEAAGAEDPGEQPDQSERSVAPLSGDGDRQVVSHPGCGDGPSGAPATAVTGAPGPLV